MAEYNAIAETDNFIVLDRYTNFYEINEVSGGYQTEASLEKELIQDLVKQGYEYCNITNPNSMLANVRIQLEKLNHVNFTNGEWARFVEEYLDKPNDNHLDKTRKIHTDYIYDFVFDDGHIQNIYLLDKKKYQ